MIKKKLFFLLFLCSWKFCIYAMEEQLVPVEPSAFNQPKLLYETCWQWLESRKKTEIAKITEDYGKPEALEGIIAKLVKKAIKTKKPGYIIYLANKLPVSLYPKIGFRILKSERFTHVKREKMLSALCWSHVLDQETKKILKFFTAYCHEPNAFDKNIGENMTEYDLFDQRLSWQALLDITTEAPYEFLRNRRTFRLVVPKNIISYLLKSYIINVDYPLYPQQLLQRIGRVLEYGASVDTNNELGETSFNYVLKWARFAKKALFYNNLLTLFVEHLMKRNDGLLFIEQHIENYESLSLDQKVEQLIKSGYNRDIIDFGADNIIL